MMFSFNKKAIFLFLALAFCMACNQGQKHAEVNDAEEDLTIKTSSPELLITDYFTTSGKKFSLIQDRSIGNSVVDLSIKTEFFSIVNDSIALGPTDPVEQAIITDLDANGFEEFLIITRSIGSGSYASLYGFASNHDKSISTIYVPEVHESDLEVGGLFEGFRGHNQFLLENGILYNSFPIYKNEDPNASPSGSRVRIVYELIAGEASWILKAIKREYIQQ